nr:immunoglobulin light chain junction region [Macaca mulatta]MOV37489.1 immunoglobulin light chain junction region [Macaca mulatta]MOV37500.1 immunoglobulin light chain junction region [Macaca mulatta]
CLQGKTSPFSF